MIEKYYDFTERQLELIEKFYQIHLDAKLNLTAIKEREEFHVKHVLDSFLLYTDKKNLIKGPVADVGTGGGFPGIVLAILYPDIQFTLIDSIVKKCKFVEDAAKELGLDNVDVIVSRSEDIKNRKFKTILSRGVAKVDQMIKYTANIADKDCVWVLYKGQNVTEELEAAKHTMKKKKMEFINVRYDEPIQRTYTILCADTDSSRLY